MKKLIVIWISFSAFLFTCPLISYGKTYAYFFGSKGAITKLDTETNTVSKVTPKTPMRGTLNSAIGADPVNNYLYISSCVRLGNCKVKVYELKTLNLIKELPLTASSSAAILMLFYPDASKFIIQYFTPGEDGEEGGYTTDLYDAKTLTRIKNLQTMFAMEQISFSTDGKKLYSIIGGDEARADVIDSTSFAVTGSIDLTKIWRSDVFASRVEDISTSKLLISEDLKSALDLPDKDDFYVYDLEGKSKSPKISTGLQGNYKLIQNGARILFDENQTMRDAAAGFITGFKSLGRLHIYDVATGKELRVISFKPQGQGKIRGIRPAGDRLYYESEGLTKDTSNITVIDIKNYQVLTTISLPFKPRSLIFFEQ